MQISIVVPTYNEEKRIGKSVGAIWQFFKKSGSGFEIIVSDDGSKDKTTEIVKRLQSRYSNLILLKNEHSGKGLTVKEGMEKALANIVLFTDADLATPISEFEKFADDFEKSSDVVIGSRGLKRIGAPLPRMIIALGLNFLVRAILGLNFSDTQCGFKAFKSKALKLILPKMLLYKSGKAISDARVTASFDLELLMLAKKQNLKISEIPVVWHHHPSAAVRPVTESFLTLIEIFKIKINDLRGKYK